MNMMPQSPAPVMSERRATIIGALLVAIGPISMALYTPAMPEIVRAFGTTEAAVKLTLSVYFGGFAIAQLFCGPLSDGFGRRPVTIAFMLVYLAASLAAALSPSIEVLIAARFVQGVGAAVGVAVSRAIVRDMFTHETSARILNTIGMMLALGPALSPTIGGLTMELFGWHAVFLLMVAFGIAIVLMTIFWQKETVQRDLSRIRPGAILRSYGSLLASPYFMLTGFMLAGTVGAFYALATMLPFVMIDRVGLTPTQFGLSMLMQSGSFFLGAMSMRRLIPRYGSRRLVGPGMALVLTGGLLLFALLHLYPPTFWTVFGPVALYACGIALVLPAVTTSSLAPFPHMAGAASSLSGFMQMGAGLAGSGAAVLIGDPVVALYCVLPVMGIVAAVSWAVWRNMPEPAAPRRAPPLPPQVS